jgi:uncharacterized YccA/Bax inhibitor family protein
MANPLFNESTLDEAAAGWAAPEPGTHVQTQPVTGVPAPVTDGPVTTWKRGMTVGGTVSATAALLAIFLIAAGFGWAATPATTTTNGEEVYQFPALGIVGIIVGFIAVLVAYRKPQIAKFLGPIYSIGYGFAVGAISRVYESWYDGIVLQAVGATLSVFVVMLVLYRTRIIKVTDKFRRTVIFATIGVMVLYGVSILLSLFGGEIAFINSPSLFGILFSVFVCGLAAFNLALDFDLIERGTKLGMSKDYEWVAALGLLVTLVWLYLEMLRLLSKLRQ